MTQASRAKSPVSLELGIELGDSGSMQRQKEEDGQPHGHGHVAKANPSVVEQRSMEVVGSSFAPVRSFAKLNRTNLLSTSKLNFELWRK
jgi:hypothetical protein